MKTDQPTLATRAGEAFQAIGYKTEDGNEDWYTVAKHHGIDDDATGRIREQYRREAIVVFTDGSVLRPRNDNEVETWDSVTDWQGWHSTANIFERPTALDQINAWDHGDPPLNLAGANLVRADLSGHYFRGVDFAGADLTQADFTGSSLTECDFTGANLADVRVEGADLPDRLRIQHVWVGGPRHRTATVWTWDGKLTITQGWITAHTLEDYLEQCNSERGTDWTTQQIEQAEAAVTAAVENITGAQQ